VFEMKKKKDTCLFKMVLSYIFSVYSTKAELVAWTVLDGWDDDILPPFVLYLANNIRVR
jgi:hypothetical protein